MKKPIQSGGGAMSDPNASNDVQAVDHGGFILLDAQNLLSQIKYLNDAIFLAANGLSDRYHSNALTTVSNIIGDKLDEVEGILDEALERMSA